MKIIHKDVFREIKKSTGRFISLFLIVGLGVAFYAGIRSCSPDMLYSADKFYDDSKLMDLRVVSTLGLTDADIRALEKVDGVERAYGVYTADLICGSGDEESVVKLISITEGVNEIVLKDGIMPVNDNECLLDESYMESSGYEIGDEITLSSGDETELKDVIKESTFIITGTFSSARYLSFERGSTTIGAGTVNGIAMVNAGAFTYDYYTEVDVLAGGAAELSSYSEEYEDLIAEVIENIEAIAPGQEARRYNDIIDSASSLIDKAKSRLEDSQSEAEEALDSAQAQLDSASSQAYGFLSDFSQFVTLLGQFTTAVYDTAEAAEEALSEVKDASEEIYNEVIDGGYDNYISADTKKELMDLNERLQNAESQEDVLNEIYESVRSVYTTLSSGIYSYINSQQAVIDEQRAQLEVELSEAESEISDSEAELDSVEEGEWYILDRTYLEDYSSYESDAEKLENIGKVFPVIFFIAAALVCLTSMTRMVDEERTQIGTLKALGYSKLTIMGKYLSYALMATLTGSVVGCVVGSVSLPLIIINVYKLVYQNLEYVLVPFNWEHCIMATVFALFCILAATFAACTKSLMEVPANLMRPEAPKQAKKLLLERIGPLWRIIPL